MSLLPTFTVNCEHLKIKNNLCIRFPYMQCDNNSHKAAYMNTQKQSIKISFYLLTSARDTGLNIIYYCCMKILLAFLLFLLFRWCLRLSRESINFFELRKVMNIFFLVQYCVHLMFLFYIITLKLRFSFVWGLE